MKKILSFVVLLVIAMGASAQSKKELQEKILELEKQSTELNALLKEKDAKVSELTLEVTQLQSEIEKLKAQVDSLQAATAPQKEAPRTLTDSISDMLHKFYSATTVEERAKYVMEPQRVLPLMRNYYKGGIKPLNEFYNEYYASEIGSGLCYMGVTLVKDYYVEHVVLRTSQGFKLDWEATVQYGETDDFMLTQANVGKTFTFHCAISNSVYKWNDDYDYIFPSSVNCHYINRYSQAYPKSGNGVFLRNGEIGKRLVNMLQNGEPDETSPEYFYVIFKGKVFDYNDGSFALELTEIVSETPSRYVPIRPKKQKRTF